MIAMEYKAGIGTASRVLDGLGTVGVLVLANFGGRRQLRVGRAPGRTRARRRAHRRPRRGDGGSCIGVVMTDIPLDARQLTRVARRVGLGLARVGSIAGNGSGDIFCAVSVGNRVPRFASGIAPAGDLLVDDEISAVFAATVEATEESVLNALFVADTVTGRNGNTAPGLPVERVLEPALTPRHPHGNRPQVGAFPNLGPCLPERGHPELVLAGEFPAPDHDQWAAAVAKALDRTGELAPGRGARAAAHDDLRRHHDRAAVHGRRRAGRRTPPGSRALAPFVRGAHRRGHPAGRLGRPPARRRRGRAPAWRSTELEKGATSVLLDLAGVGDARRGRRVGGALDGVLLDLAGVVLDAGARWQRGRRRDRRPPCTPARSAPTRSASPRPTRPPSTSTRSSTPSPRGSRRLGADRPDLRVVTVDGTRFHDAGASDAQQLGATDRRRHRVPPRASTHEASRPADAIARIELRLAATADQFATIATFRAARRAVGPGRRAGRRRRTRHRRSTP